MPFTLFKLVAAEETSRRWRGRLSGAMQYRIIRRYKGAHSWMTGKQKTGEYLYDRFGEGKYRLKDDRGRIIFEGTVRKTWLLK